MNIQCPWKFDCENYHIVLTLRNNLRLNKIFGEEITYNRKTSKIVLTFSHVNSNINKKQNIIYNEFIVKFETQHLGKSYFYPAISFVNNEYSIIRGYFLGFDKKMANLNIKKNIINFNSKETYINFSCIKNNENSNYISLPFILNRNFNFDINLKANDCVSLKTEEYTIKDNYCFSLKLEDMEKLLGEIGLSIDLVASYCGTYIKDEFIVTGVEKINEK